MFQATETTAGHQRPAIMHAYGGAKVGIERSLASIAPEGWVPLAAAMLGTPDKPPMWACVGLRPVAGTTIDFRVLPPSLSERETLLMLSCWQQWDTTAAPSSALSQWLVDIEVDYGPDGQLSPTYLNRASTFKRQQISIKQPTCIPWKPWQRMAPTPRSSASLHSESSPMNTLEKPSRQFTFSRLQGTCQTSSPMISGLRRSGGMVIPRLLQ